MAKTHQNEFYQMYTKLLPMQLNADVNATVKVDAEQQAVEALKNALMRVIEVQRADLQTSEEARNVAAEAGVVTGVSYSKTTAAEPEPAVTPPPSPAPALAPQDNIFPLRNPLTAAEAFVAPISAEQTTTQKYLEWAGNNGGRVRSKDWGPV